MDIKLFLLCFIVPIFCNAEESRAKRQSPMDYEGGLPVSGSLSGSMSPNYNYCPWFYPYCRWWICRIYPWFCYPYPYYNHYGLGEMPGIGGMPIGR